ncbi:MAG: SpoIIE family protein phosphatase [Planctomycetes bacterium]|nr:SpoIIE family protein phosphatase [Planctomycetota bacterium]
MEPSGRGGTLPIAVKLSIFTGFLVGALVVSLGLAFSHLSYQAIDEQVNHDGVKLATLLGAASREAARMALVGSRGSSEDRGDFPALAAARKRFQEVRKEVVEGHLKETPAADILAMNILTGDGKEVLLGEAFRIGVGGTWAWPEGASAAVVEIGEGHLGSERVRQYSRALQEEGEKQPFARAVVWLRADAIDRVQEAVRVKILAATGIGLAVGVLLAFGLGTLLTRPLRELVLDMQRVASGDLDYSATVRSRDEVGVLAGAFNAMIKGLRVAREQELGKKALEHELAIATEIQTKLLPDRIPRIPGFDIFAFYLSAKEVGGDYYDFITVGPHHLGMVVADVSGKGIPGSMVMTMTRSLARLAAKRNPSAADTLKKVNHVLAKDMRRGMFVTACYMVLEIPARAVTVASAGHNPTFVYRAATRTCEKVNPGGIALGFDKGPIFDSHIKEETVRLESGDRVVAYTDGVVEAVGADESEFGEERFMGLIREHADKGSNAFVNAVIADLDLHRGKADQSDDITILTLRLD